MPDRCEQLDDYLDGLLDKEERILFEEHLADCSTCSLEVQTCQSLEQSLRDYASQLHAPAPLVLENPIKVSRAPKGRTSESTGHHKTRHTRWTMVVIAASLLLLSAGGLWMMRGDGENLNSANGGTRASELPTGSGAETTASPSLATDMRPETRITPSHSREGDFVQTKSKVSVRELPDEDGPRTRLEINALATSTHIAVVDDSADDQLTLVMLYPKFTSSTKDSDHEE